jgi:hypothetical protein
MDNGAIDRESPAPHPGGDLPIDTAQIPAVPSSPQSRNELVLVEPQRRPLPPMTMEQGDDEANDALVSETVDEAAIATTRLPDSSSWLRELELRERDPRVTEQLRRVLDRR